MRKSIAAALIAASAATAACNGHGVEGGGRTVSRNYEVGKFDQIEVAGPYDVQVTTGGNASVAARGAQNLLAHTIVEVKDGKLEIHPEHGGGMFNFGRSMHGTAQFTVTVPQLSGAAIAGSGDIHVDHVRGDSFEGNVAGSGGLNVGSVDVKSLRLSIGGSGNLKAGSGSAESAEYNVGGSGDIDARGVTVQEAKASIAGSGNIAARATQAADVSIMGSGDVELTGGAKCNVSKMGSGTANCS
jgi:hypothetical protein